MTDENQLLEEERELFKEDGDGVLPLNLRFLPLDDLRPCSVSLQKQINSAPSDQVALHTEHYPD